MRKDEVSAECATASGRVDEVGSAGALPERRGEETETSSCAGCGAGEQRGARHDLADERMRVRDPGLDWGKGSGASARNCWVNEGKTSSRAH
mmetsp:Transcript_35297/g.92635  ORF Transcript_35297/g.92635 Transcript_35297/m.92635 type:complete len:92 (-) Transcript_35297:175-450(-)